jgi:hypothetical protein
MLAQLATACDLGVGVGRELGRGDVGVLFLLKHLTASELNRVLRRELAGPLEHSIGPIDQRRLAAHEIEDEASTDLDRVVHDVAHSLDHSLPA